MRRLTLAIGITLVLVTWQPISWERTVHGQIRALTVAPNTLDGVRDWNNTVNRMLRTSELQVRLQRADTLIPGRTIEQLDQYYNGVLVWGGSVSRQLAGGSAISVFGTLYADIALDITPTLTQTDAKAAVERIGGAELGPDRLPRLVILPTDDGSFRLVWVGEIFTSGDRLRLFIDAKTGEVVRRDSLLQTQVPNAPVGHGKGVLGDDKKVSTLALGGTFVAFDTLRPPDIRTYDLRSNLTRAIQFLNGVLPLSASDFATSTNNDWTDAASVDAHVYSSYTYDYYYKRFGRRGLDNADKRILNMTHLVRRSDVFSASQATINYFVNAFYAGDGVMAYGEGCVCTFDGQRVNYLAGALDVVAHELTHGVTQYTSNLEYRNESGALNEAFSDMMGTSVEFFFQPAGNGLMKGDYLIAEDVFTTGLPGTLNGIRSMENPAIYEQPDHYSRRFIGPPNAEHDNGGVHINSGIANQAFYLAIEGGTNRTSRIRVQGVGPSNREQIEKVFYRAFAQLMPSNANFALARVIALRAAQDLYGLNSAPYNAVRDAWAAVGVN